MTLTNLQKAEMERSALEVTVNSIETIVNGHSTATPLSQASVKQLNDDLNAAQVELKEVNKKIYLCSPPDTTPHSAAFQIIYTKIIEQRGKLGVIQAAFPAPRTTAPSSKDEIKLPKIDIPVFCGDITEWINFRDMFQHSIHQKSSLPRVQKLTYLKSLLEGEAARHVKNLALTDANYDTAWQALTDRYENEREQLFAVLKKFHNQQQVSSSVTSIRNLLDTSKGCISLFSNMSGTADHMFIYNIFTKLDHNSKELWFQTNDATKIPTINEVYNFLEQRALALSAGSSSSSSTSSSSSSRVRSQGKVHNHHTQQVGGKCSLSCGDSHRLYKCSQFLKLSPQQRSDHIKARGYCYNCLGEGHSATDCPSSSLCKTCNRKHNTLLHFNKRVNFVSENSGNSTSTVINNHGFQNGELPPKLLATAVITIQSQHGDFKCRALIDNGSTNSYITRDCARKLSLQISSCSTSIIGLSSTSVGHSSGTVDFVFISNDGEKEKNQVNALVIPQITNNLPIDRLNPDSWSYLKGLQLADPKFYIPSKIDVLLGTDVFWYILRNGIKRRGSTEPVAVNSSLGWLIGGYINSEQQNTSTSFLTNTELNHALEKFWIADSTLSPVPELTIEEQEAEQHFNSTVTRVNGRFITCIPWKKSHPPLGESRQLAVKRLKSLERRLSSDNLKKYKEEYVKFMNEYIQLGHMTRVPPAEVSCPKNPTYFIPHHFVLKPDSTTTKLRVVFDASAKTSNKLSLNDIMLVGPVVQSTLLEILLRFRTHPIAFTADITKMYRQIGIPAQDSDLHRIVWREDPSHPIEEYRLNTVTYGTAAAPYLATKCLQRLADDEKQHYPVAAEILRRDFYVDDLQSGMKTPAAAITTIQQLITMCKSAGLELRKWTCSNAAVLSTIPEDLREQKELIPVEDDNTIKTLGIHWHPAEDNYRFKINISQDTQRYTKRIVASEMAKIFDPVGWLAPVTVKGKILLQEMWKLKTDWDDILPFELQQQWVEYKKSLQYLENVRIPRLILPKRTSIHLIGFGDSSLKAYSAVVYVYCENDNNLPSVSLVTSKTRVASMNSPTLPRLELNAAVLLAELMVAVEKALQIEFNSIRAYSDSTITLCWIKSDPNRWKQYVRNRVIKIQNCIPAEQWYHVAGESNPADCASRGLLAQDLVDYKLWWNGNTNILTQQTQPTAADDTELRKEERPQEVFCHLIGLDSVNNLIQRFSSFSKLRRVTALIIRAQENHKRKQQNLPPSSGQLVASELKSATIQLVKFVQKTAFSTDVAELQRGRQLSTNSKLLPLNPIIDEHGLIRVGGRLRHAKINTEIKHPIILPRHHHLVNLIIQDAHQRYFHCGQTQTLATLMQQYWVIRGRDAVRHVIKKCVTCTRHRGATLQQIMGDLPEARVNPAPCFQKCGVDYAGPFSSRNHGRSKITFKSYLVIFVCFSTKALHIELATSLSTDLFMAAFRRFISRRGIPTDIYSDCGTNFVGAKRELDTIQAQMQNVCADEAIRWHFNPPGAPHFGGLWEAGVKSVKYHLTRVMGSTVLTYEELYTLTTQIEAILNSRPLTPISADPDDLEVLTPAHFIIGRPLTSAPDYDFSDSNVGRLDRWQLLQQKQQLFWSRWHKEYISRMQQRPKWMKISTQVKVNDIVIIKEENTPPAKWRLGRVTDTHPGDDGMVRVVTLKTLNGIVKRPIHKLCVLPVID